MDRFLQLFGRFVQFSYACWDRIVLRGYYPALQRPENVVHFFRDVCGDVMHGIACRSSMTRWITRSMAPPSRMPVRITTRCRCSADLPQFGLCGQVHGLHCRIWQLGATGTRDVRTPRAPAWPCRTSTEPARIAYPIKAFFSKLVAAMRGHLCIDVGPMVMTHPVGS